MALLKLPDLRQKDNHSCGEVAHKIALEYCWGVRPRKIVSSCPINGLHPSNFPVVFRREGLKYVSGAMTIDDLRHHQRNDRPVIVLVQQNGQGHYVVSSGVSRGSLHFQNPTDGPGRKKTDDFTKDWWDHDADGNEFRQWGIAVWQ